MKRNPLFLSDKFMPASLPEVCAPRKNLLALLDKAAEDGFVFVSAQGGSGKTVSTLLWLNRSRRIPVWIGLDSFDNSPSVFYKLLATGLYSLQPDNENMKKILMDTAFSATPVEHTVELMSEMYLEDRQYVIVLDDFHLIKSGEIIKSLPLVLRRLPRAFTVFVLSRGEVPDEFRPLLKDEKKDVIRREDLRFTESEIRQYLNIRGHFLTPDEIKFAYMATDGWAIGVNAIAMSGQIGGRGEYDFADFFEDLTWNTWDDERRDFCIRTSIVDEFDTELGSALSGREDAPELMEALSRSNSFLSRLHGDTYRYHHLFQEFLQKQMHGWAVDGVMLYKTAAQYYKDHGDYSHALRYWLMSGDYKGTDNFLFLFLFRGHKNGVADYADFLHSFFMESLPERAAREAPVLHVLYAWYYYLTSHFEEYAKHMDAIIRNLPRIAKAGNEFVEFAMLAFHVDYRKPLKTQVTLFKMFGKVLKFYTPSGLATNIASFTHNLPYMHRSNRDYSEIALNPGILDKIDNTFAPLLGPEWKYLRPGILVSFTYERNQLEDALEQNTAVLRLIGPENKPDGRICVMILQHSILWQLGRFQEAGKVMDDLNEFVDASAQYFLPNLTAYRTKLRLFRGDRAAAAAWMDQYYVTETDHIEFFRSFQHFTTARAYAALGKTEKALHYLLLLREFGKNLNRPLDRCEAGVVLASLYWTMNQKKEAEAELEAALEILQPYGFIRVVADEGETVVPILKRILSRVSEKDYAGPLTRSYINEVMLAAHRFGKDHAGYMAGVIKRKDKPLKLSKQQAYMLTLLSQGYKNADISEITGLSIPTIKSHTAIAYKKLGVNNAMDAVLKARELGVIE
ncbi:LuxR C-terminal-related transcriptional regulator [Anaerolentibacter hominis]|uniref:LuxR C-terminal-related transcriptional regulator n=1 Tax=Anaerolentibacter hominis TaxID=3079009 RepID=UPI0031B85FC1